MIEEEIITLVENSSFKDWNDEQKVFIKASIIENLKLLKNKRSVAEYYMKTYYSFDVIYEKLNISLKDWDNENYRFKVKDISLKKRNIDIIPIEKLKSFTSIRERLLKIRLHICEICGWNYKNHKSYNESYKFIPLEIHHIDGDRLNNKESNLQLICPNCHAMTDNFRARNVKKKQKFLSNEDTLKIRKLFSEGSTLFKLSQDFNVHYQTIVKIVNYETHTDLIS
jgi:hypothetical protein